MRASLARCIRTAALLLSLGLVGTIATLAAGRVSASVWGMDDNLLAHRLLQEGRAAEAAETFTDPAWKGIALYRSGQWWRAAEAFVRAEDPVSAYNLGNCYVRLGYYALALEAYQRALGGDPALSDAARNADLMRQLLAEERSGEQGGGSQDGEEAIDRLERDPAAPAPDGGAGDEDEQDEDDETTPPGATPSDSPADAGAGDEPNTQDPTGDEGQTRGEGRTHRDATRRTDGTGEAQGGQTGEPAEAARAGGASDGAARALGDDVAAGLRAQRESEQADEQWLNRIRHDPARFLDKRIRLEMRRRIAAGQSAPAGGDGW